MGEFSGWWALLIIGITIGIYKIIVPFISGKKNRTIWLVAIISICIYSGIGISYSSISKTYIGQYIVYILVIGISLAIFTKCEFTRKGNRISIRKRSETIKMKASELAFWNSTLVANTFIVIMLVYFVLRCGSLIYPVNKLSSLSITYDAVNNLKNISGENANILNSIASYIKPMAYIGMFYAFKKVWCVAILLSGDLLITLIYTGYLSRNLIICVLFIVLMLYFNNDLSDKYISLNQKKKRIVLTIGIVTPIVLYMMIYLMTIRTTGQSHWTIMSFFSSEIDYPKHYQGIDAMNVKLMKGKDMLLHILDSFVPFISTPSYTSNLNVLFSEKITGVSMDLSWFSVLLPSIMGEAKLIFGKNFFWIHAIIISFMMSVITRVTRDNPKMVILYYYYITCVMKAARAGYAELSSTVMFNIVIMIIFLGILKMIYSTIHKRKI